MYWLQPFAGRKDSFFRKKVVLCSCHSYQLSWVSLSLDLESMHCIQPCSCSVLGRRSKLSMFFTCLNCGSKRLAFLVCTTFFRQNWSVGSLINGIFGRCNLWGSNYGKNGGKGIAFPSPSLRALEKLWLLVSWIRLKSLTSHMSSLIEFLLSILWERERAHTHTYIYTYYCFSMVPSWAFETWQEGECCVITDPVSVSKNSLLVHGEHQHFLLLLIRIAWILWILSTFQQLILAN